MHLRRVAGGGDGGGGGGGGGAAAAAPFCPRARHIGFFLTVHWSAAVCLLATSGAT